MNSLGVAVLRGPAWCKPFKPCALTAAALAAQTMIACASLVGYWSFDEGAGTTIHDSSGWGNHGVLVNAKANTWTNGHAGRGLYFDGSTGAGSTYVLIPDAPSLHMTNAISFAAWVRCDDITTDAPILDKEAAGKLTYWFGAFGSGSPGNFGVLLGNNGQSWGILDRDQGNISQGQWMHVASTWDGATIRHYLNGALLPQTAAFAGPLPVTDASLVMGANYPFSFTAFKGIMDEARIYDHALSQAEIQALVGATRRLVAHWSFDEGAGTNIFDGSGLGNHGTLVNPQTNTWTQGIKGAALYFPGVIGTSATGVSVPDSPSLRVSTEITFAAWVRCDDIHRDAPIVAKEFQGKLSYWFGAYGLTSDGGAPAPSPGNFGMLLDADGNQPWTCYNRNQGAVPQGQWVHLASAWDGTAIRHYMNGQQLSHTGNFPAPTHVSDAYLAIGVNSGYHTNSADATSTAFLGAIDEVMLYNYALSSSEIQSLYLSTGFQITSVRREGNDLRLTWRCTPGSSYVLQTNVPGLGDGLTTFNDMTPPISIPSSFTDTTTNYLHLGGVTRSQAVFYRIKLLP